VNSNIIVVILAAGVATGTPLVYAAIGELLAERSGVLNLGVEGMMLVGAVVGFWIVSVLQAGTILSLLAAVVAAALAGMALSAVHAWLCVKHGRNQIVSGLALAMFGIGLSSFIGDVLGLGSGSAHHQFRDLSPFGAGDWPIVGPILIKQSALVYASWVLVALVAFYLWRTRAGLNVRAVGESPRAADTAGINVRAYRYGHVLAGGALAGIGGACLSTWLTPQWVGGGLLTGGMGWIAIALVIFAFWRPWWVLAGAYLFGSLTALSPNLQARQISAVPLEVFQATPYVLAIVVVVVARASVLRNRAGTPTALGEPYDREKR
jgi:ABC-type uncharacterized transport system permease subunit